MERVLRDVVDDDIATFFEQQNDPEAIEMAAFPPREWEPFRAHWGKIQQDETAVAKTIVCDGLVAGNVLSWPRDDRRYVGYWLRREVWGKGVAGPPPLREARRGARPAPLRRGVDDEHRFDPRPREVRLRGDRKDGRAERS